MILRSNYTEAPSVKRWGEKYIVPINIVESATLDSEGNEIPLFSADVIENVMELTVSSILKAAISSEYSQSELDYIMLNITEANNAKVEAYKAFIASIKSGAKAAGYPD